MKNYSDFPSFTVDFATDDDCRRFLMEQKWGTGFICRRCGHTKSVKGRTWYYRRCQSCKYDESCTAHTLFHKIKFPLVKAFWIVFQLSTLKKGMSTCAIAQQYGIHQETAWFFKRKVQQAQSNVGEDLLLESIEVDETMFGRDPDSKGRYPGTKSIIQVAIEVDFEEKNGEIKQRIKRARAKHIKDFSADTLSEGIEEMIDDQALVTTDGWAGYENAMGERWHLVFNSDGGEDFKKLHWFIFTLKNWLRGIHHKVSSFHLQKYLNEFIYRFNRRNIFSSSTSEVLKSMVKSAWMPYRHAIEM